jgi:hypothetical protein
MAAEPKLSPGNGFFLKPDGTWGVSKVPAAAMKGARFIGNLRIRGYESAVFETPSGQQWGQKIIEKPEDVEATVASLNLSKIASVIAIKTADDSSPFDLEDVEDKFGTDEAKWLSDQIEKFWVESENEDGRSAYDCVDNYRLAIKGDQPSMNKFDEIDSRGCCGSANLEFGPSPNGQTYMYGFNYGH